MDNETKFSIFLILIVICIIGLAVVFKKHKCEMRWAASGMLAKWSVSTGCMLETEAEHWIPADNYQERAP